MSDPLDIRIEAAGGPQATALIAELDAEIRRRYPGEPVHGIVVERFEATGGIFCVGYAEGRALACGALRPTEMPGEVEVKRMFVCHEARGRGYARQMLVNLERKAADRGYVRIVLETGAMQPEAIALYESSGYARISPYGEFVDDSLSRCFAKSLA